MSFKPRLGGRVGAFSMDQCADVGKGRRRDGGREDIPGPREEKIKNCQSPIPSNTQSQ